MENASSLGMTRAFICIEMPDEVIKEIARVQEALGNKRFTGKMTELENLHLTLKFLGELNDKKIEEIKERLSKINLIPFEAKLGVLGSFGHRGEPRIIWVKIGGAGIFELHKSVDSSLEGLAEKEKRFMSHMTIARVRYVEDKPGFFKHLSSLWVKEISWKVDKFYLKKSELHPNGPRYSNLAEYSLRAKKS